MTHPVFFSYDHTQQYIKGEVGIRVLGRTHLVKLGRPIWHAKGKSSILNIILYSTLAI